MFSVMVHMLYILLTLLARIACIPWNAGYCYRRRDVDWFVFVCPFGTLASPAKTDEPIEMLSERGQTCVGQRNRVLYCTKVHTGATWRIQWNNLYDGDDEGYRYHYCSNLLSMFSFFLSLTASTVTWWTEIVIWRRRHVIGLGGVIRQGRVALGTMTPIQYRPFPRLDSAHCRRHVATD